MNIVRSTVRIYAKSKSGCGIELVAELPTPAEQVARALARVLAGRNPSRGLIFEPSFYRHPSYAVTQPMQQAAE